MTTRDDASSGDALFQISEPLRHGGRTRRLEPGRAVGIDLGTTHSLLATAAAGTPPLALEVDPEGGQLMPSVVAYVDGAVQVGSAAMLLAAVHPEQVLSSVKRFMGRGLGDIDFQHPYRLQAIGESGLLHFEVSAQAPAHAASARPLLVNPVQVSATILRTLVDRAEQQLGYRPKAAVITVPAYFDDSQRQATRDAGRVAGIEVLRLLAEPTAAAVAYGLDRGGRGTFAVYDLGGGTFDISILALHDGVFKVLATAGDAALGGDDFDRSLASVLLGRDVNAAGTGAQDRVHAGELQVATTLARALKESLSDADAVSVPETYAHRFPGAQLTRAHFEELIARDVQRTLAVCRDALKQAGVRVGELDGVVLVGGSTRIPLVRRRVAELFKREALADIDPDRVVAHGAAIQADILSGSAREGITLLDVVPLSLGIETMGGIVEKVIPRNATIPIAAKQTFTNYSEQQTGMTIKVVQGERELSADCRSLAEFELKGIPRLPPSMARVEVTFELDADGLLTVTARELMTGQRQSVEIKPSYGLSESEVDRLVDESLEQARHDMDARNAAEARIELGRVLLALRSALDEAQTNASADAGLLRPEERDAVQIAIAAADTLMAIEPPATTEAIRGMRERLEQVSEPYARRRMENALAQGVAGRTLTQIERALLDGEEGESSRRGGHAATLIESDDD